MWSGTAVKIIVKLLIVMHRPSDRKMGTEKVETEPERIAVAAALERLESVKIEERRDSARVKEALIKCDQYTKQELYDWGHYKGVVG